MKGLLGGLVFALAAAPALAAEGDLCAQPTEIQGFKTCADVGKAEAEGELVVYATNPEAAELRVLAEFNKLFPKIKTNYTRLQAGALYAEARRRASGEDLHGRRDAAFRHGHGPRFPEAERLRPLRLAADGGV